METSGSITLGDVVERTVVLAVACSRCERARRYNLDTLIARHGEGFGIPRLLRLLSKIAQSAHPLVPMTCAAFIARNCRRSFWARLRSAANCSGVAGRRRLRLGIETLRRRIAWRSGSWQRCPDLAEVEHRLLRL
jgi:hypothetical protein